ncbi:STAS domain-containing protein [bacterium]|nr:STAS domain-containing protein [bacterium]
MQFDKEIINDVLVVRVHEPRITMHEAPDVKTDLLGMMIEDVNCILLNLKEVQKMDSTGLGALLFGIRQAEQHDKDFCVCELNDKVQFLIRIAHLDDTIDVFETEKDAIDVLTEERGDD